MEQFELTSQDRDLLRETVMTSDRLYLEGIQEVASAIRTTTGKVFSAIHFETKVGYANVCGEVAAICCMVAGGHRDLDTIAAVWRNPQGQHFLLPPCGRCRDLIHEFQSSRLGNRHFQVEPLGRGCH